MSRLQRASLVVAVTLGVAAIAEAGPRLEAIKRRGFLTCGVEPIVAGFAEVDAAGRYRGFDVDICRALAAAVLGNPDKIKFVTLLSVADLRRSDDVDVVSRRLTWELRRETPLGLLFGPITFYDGQSFLVPAKLGATTPRQLAGRSICVAGGTVFELNLNVYFESEKLRFEKVVLESPHKFDEIAQALAGGRCQAYSADVSELGAIRTRLPRRDDFQILSGHISREPLAPLVRADDTEFFTIVRWTIHALINAEELGVTSKNVDAMRKSANLDVQRLLGVVPGNGAALGLSESWAYDAIRTVGNYGEIFDKNLGRASPVGLERGLNRLSSDGGLMYAPPLR